MSLKILIIPPGIDPGTVRLVAQRLNHYATSGPDLQVTIDEIRFIPVPANLWHAYPKWQGEKFPCHSALTALSNCLNFFHPTSVSIMWRICACMHVTDCIVTVYELPLLPNNTASETFLHKWGTVQSVTGYFSLGRRPGGDWENKWHWTERFKSSLNKK
jgi:hypothetical protein